MKNFYKAVAVIALSGMCMAAPAPSAGEAPAKKATKKHHKAAAAKVEAKKDETAEQVRQLKEAVDQQQAATQQLQQQLQQTQQQLQQTQQQLTATQQEAQKAAAKAAEVESNNVQVQKVQADLSDVKTALNATTQQVEKTEKKVDYLEHPVSISYKGVKLTPGGFLAAESVWRQHDETTDVLSSFNGIPYTSTPTSHLTEWRFTARQSRATLLAEGQAGKAKLTGYYEVDFLGAAPTANENQSNSFNLRQRQLFGKVAVSGWAVTAGQTWSLLAMNRKGAEARAEWVPATIDAQYVPGFTFARLATARVAKSFGDNKATIAFSVENPAVLVAGVAPAAPVATPILTGAGTASLGNGNNYTIALAPDLIGKITFDPRFGHFEIKAVGRFFRDRINATATTLGSNQLTLGGGLGAGAIIPIVPKKVDFVAEGLVGRGSARYGDSSNADVTYRQDGSLSTIKNLQAIAGIEAHPMPKLDIYVYAGDEYLGRNVYGTGATATGYGIFSGSRAVNNTSCFIANSGTCNALMKSVMQATGGFWYNIYKGAYGSFRYGMQYSYTYKNTWGGVNTNAGATTTAPKANENMAFTSIRYYLP